MRRVGDPLTGLEHIERRCLKLAERGSAGEALEQGETRRIEVFHIMIDPDRRLRRAGATRHGHQCRTAGER
jgi:hypothetical protein